MKSRRDESGTAIIEFVWLAILLLIPLLYVVLAVFDTHPGTSPRSFLRSAAASSRIHIFVISLSVPRFVMG